MKKVILFTLLAATVAIAQPRRMAHPGARQGMERIIEHLDLKEDQQKQFHKLHSLLQKNQIATHAKIQALRIDLRELFNIDGPDKSAIESKLTEISKMQNEMKLNHTAFWFDVNKMLTADQQKIWRHVPMLDDHGPRNFKMPRMRRGHDDMEDED